MVCSNCEHVKMYIGERLVAELDPDRQNFQHLPYPPFVTNLRQAIGRGWGDLRIDGFIGGQKVISKTLSGQGADRQFHLVPDDLELIGDGIDATRVVMRVTDEFGAVRPLANAAITLMLEGPGEIIGENPFSLFGGVGAVWIKAKEVAGTIRLNAKHPALGTKTIEIRVKRPAAEGMPII
jgi:beta-galactosidase